jgi:hypothetical protein
MPNSIINADSGVTSGTTGLVTGGGDTGVLEIQTNGVTAATVNASQILSLVNALPAGSGGTGLTSAGASGNVLTSNGTTWTSAAPAGGGKVLQVVSTVKSNTFSTTSSTGAAVTGFSVTITPSSASSDILVMVTATTGSSTTSGSALSQLTIQRNGTQLYGFFDSSGSASNRHTIPQPKTILDSPNTTSAVTYQVYLRSGNGTAYFNTQGFSTSDVSFSTITAMEIAA